MKIERGFPEHQRAQVAGLFWDAFSGKLGRIMRPEPRALTFIATALSPRHAFSAQSDSGELMGAVGIKTAGGGLLTAGFSDLAGSYGTLGALWRGPLLDIMERPLTEGQILMDGLFVDARYRGLGVGSALIDAVVEEARSIGMDEVRLDVIDTNLRARALYERLGFVPTGRVNLGVFSRIFGFHHSTTMCLPVTARRDDVSRTSPIPDQST